MPVQYVIVCCRLTADLSESQACFTTFRVINIVTGTILCALFQHFELFTIISKSLSLLQTKFSQYVLKIARNI